MERQVYDQLFQGELVAFLASRVQAYDLVASADTLCYFGSLAGFCHAVQTSLRPGGVLVFTVEAHADDAGLPDFVLRAHGRYSQSRSYVESSLREVGLVDVATQPVILRNEGGKPVDGWLVSARAAGAR
jgi:predicted TPR repeat methyltransferase